MIKDDGIKYFIFQLTSIFSCKLHFCCCIYAALWVSACNLDQMILAAKFGYDEEYLKENDQINTHRLLNKKSHLHTCTCNSVANS